jgi:cytidylate kinase
MLRKLDIPERVAKYLTEDSTSEIGATIGELVGLHPNLWSLMEKSNCLIRQLAAQGNCILIGRGANYVASLLARGLHVRLVGDPEDRAARMSRLLKVEVKEARARNAKSDAARRRYVLANFGREVDDPMGYDVVVNSSRVGLGEIASMLAGLVAARVPVRSG